MTMRSVELAQAELRPKRLVGAKWPRIEHAPALYEIGRVLARFNSIDRAISAIADLVSEVLHQDSLLVTVEPPFEPRTVEWRADGRDDASASAAEEERALAFLAYLSGANDGAGDDGASDGARPHDIAGGGSAGHFLILPLVSPPYSIYGVIQIVRRAPFSQSDVAFADRVASEIGVALEREARRQRLEVEAGAASERLAVLEEERADAQSALWCSRWLQERHERLMDRIDGFVWEANPRTARAIYASDGVRGVLATEPGACVGRNFYLEMTFEDDRHEVATKLADVVATGEPRRFHHRVVDGAGGTRWVRTTLRLERENRPEPALVGMTIDVSDMVEERQAVEREVDLGRALTASVAEGVLAIENGQQVTFVNHTASGLLGDVSGWAVGKPIAEVLDIRRADGSPIPKGLCPLARALESGEPSDIEEALFVPVGSAPFLATFAVLPIFHKNGVAGAAVVFRNILEVKRAERMHRFLADVSAGLGATLEHRAAVASVAHMSVPFFADACWIDELDEHGGLTRVEVSFADPSRQHLAPKLRGALPPGSLDERVLASNEGAIFESLTEEVLAKEVRDEKLSVVLRSMQARSMLVVPLSIRRSKLGCITFVTAESGRRYSQQDLAFAAKIAARASMTIEAADALRRATRSAKNREDTLAKISHDLRTPLHSIAMSASALAEEVTEDTDRAGKKRKFQIIQRSVRRMERMLKDLLDLTSIEAGTLSIQVEPVVVSEVVDDVAEQLAPHAYEKSISLTAAVGAQGLRVRCDRDRIVQVLSNLVGNAIKYCGPGARVSLAAREERGAVLFDVVDDGPGIAPEQLPRLFDRAWRGTVRGGGHGLGLYIVKGILASHGTDIRVESEPGERTSFSFTLPLANETA